MNSDLQNLNFHANPRNSVAQISFSLILELKIDCNRYYEKIKHAGGKRGKEEKEKDGQEEAAVAPSTAGTAARLVLGDLLEAFGVPGRRNAEDLISGHLDHITSRLQPGLYLRRRRGLCNGHSLQLQQPVDRDKQDKGWENEDDEGESEWGG
ncbi:hypothetical protein SLEP1_g35810 [Rubroshorea leprosula]|uniref:Uncharacterized protein n=1 Tax=Rubroshorea leprosula TaxID=152421 RepID=A0AAV5KPK1_9ROSI|nr:hypothetical protein SLEP1_g35810 [Rubroshorea leprosula]